MVGADYGYCVVVDDSECAAWLDEGCGASAEVDFDCEGAAG